MKMTSQNVHWLFILLMIIAPLFLCLVYALSAESFYL